jgi:hypothetical protein
LLHALRDQYALVLADQRAILLAVENFHLQHWPELVYRPGLCDPG